MSAFPVSIQSIVIFLTSGQSHYARASVISPLPPFCLRNPFGIMAIASSILPFSIALVLTEVTGELELIA